MPNRGTAWNQMKADADALPSLPSPSDIDIQDKDGITDVRVMAAALVWRRNSTESYRTKVRQACLLAAAIVPPNAVTEPSGSDMALAWSRNLTGYVIGAELVGFATIANSETFRNWLIAALPIVRKVHVERPNNFGTHAGVARAAVALYLNDTNEEMAAWNVFRRYLGDADPTNPFRTDALWAEGWAQNPSRWGGTQSFVGWQGEQWPLFFGINRPGTSAHGCPPHIIPNGPNGWDVAGALPDDQRRGDCSGTACTWDCAATPLSGACCFTWPPIATGYTYEALQGVIAQAVIHERRGRDPWSIAQDANGHGAILRAFEWLRDVSAQPIGHPINNLDDYWQTYVVNQIYHSVPGFVGFPELTNGIAGKGVGYAEWTTLNLNWP